MIEIMNMCETEDIMYSLAFVSSRAQNIAKSRELERCMSAEYKTYVLSVRNDVEHLGEVSPGIRALSGNMHHIKGLDVDLELYINLIIGGHLDCIKKIHTKKILSTYLTECAAGSGQLEILKYFYENGYKMNKLAFNAALTGNHIECAEYIANHTDCNIMTRECFITAIKSGNLEFVKIIQEGAIINKNDIIICRKAIRCGNLHILKYLYDNGFVIDRGCIGIAIGKDMSDIVDYICKVALFEIRKDNCTSTAASLGSIKCLEYFHENGFKFKKQTYEIAIEKNRLDCFIYMHEKGYEWPKRILFTAKKYGRHEFVNYILEHMY